MADERSILGELLYVISNYEKAAICSLHWWKRKRIKRTKNSLRIMTDIVNYLDSYPKMNSNNELHSKIICYFEEQGQIIVSNEAFEKIKYNLKNNDFNSVRQTNNQNIENQMKYIIQRLNNVQHWEFRKKAKNEMSAYLYAFHNLPKALISNTHDTILGVTPVFENEAIEYSIYWLNKER